MYLGLDEDQQSFPDCNYGTYLILLRNHKDKLCVMQYERKMKVANRNYQKVY